MSARHPAGALLVAALLALGGATALAAQSEGAIGGRVKEADSGRSLAGVQVLVTPEQSVERAVSAIRGN